MDDQREREIALGLREGRPDAWHALYDEFAPNVWQAVSRWLGPRHAEIADIVQETFMAAAGAARQYDDRRGSLARWLGGIARNKIALFFRKQKRHERLDAGPDGAAAAGRLLLWLEDREFDPAAALEAVELAGFVRATLTALPGDYETLLVAKYVDGESVEQIAVAEQSTPVAVRSKLARARQAFREHFVKTTSAYSSDSEERVQ
jgi:RNA polymerase sigma-70 factor (ECF subfamily)